MSNIRRTILGLIAVWSAVAYRTDACSPNGKTYFGTQWATCLTDSYIRLYSKGLHMFSDPTVTSCYYQCMLESHKKENGE